jgi:hypothetical protein
MRYYRPGAVVPSPGKNPMRCTVILAARITLLIFTLIIIAEKFNRYFYLLTIAAAKIFRIIGEMYQSP